MANPLQYLDRFGDAVRRLVKTEDGPLDLLEATDEQLARWLAEAEAPKPKQTMDRLAGVIEARGLHGVGEWGNVTKGLRGLSPDEIGPGGLTTRDWVKILGELPDAPDYAPVYITNPVTAVASQYPEHLRGQAVDAARRFQIPIGNSASILFQSALADDGMKSVVFAYPRRQSVGQGYSGLASLGATTRTPGLAEVAAGRDISAKKFDSILLHELRHTLEGDGIMAKWRHPAWQNWTMPGRLYDEQADRYYRYSPQNKEYLSNLQEEVARFADARARYATESGRLIDNVDEADEVARAALANERGLGAGFNSSERAFYRAAREASPEIRAHQNRLLQGLLSVPAVVGVMGDEE